MNTKPRIDNEPGEPGMFESFPKPNTIPGGWEVSAFASPDRGKFNRSEAVEMKDASSKQATKLYEQS